MDKFKIDSHKLMFHVPRVNQWMNRELVYPIYMEVSPIGACNHRCSFCGLDFMKYSNRKIETAVFEETLPELAALGLKSIMYAGEGEPFLHKDIADIVILTKKSGIDVAITSNGVLFTEKLAPKIIPCCSWIKFSINAGTPETYAKIHGTKSRDYEKLIANLKYAVAYRQENRLNCTLGAQALLLPENESEIELLAQTMKDIGMDYLVVKPYSHHPQSLTQKYKDITYSKYEYMAKHLEKYNAKHFSVIFRLNTMQNWDNSTKAYQRCLGLPFWSYIDAGSNVWGCSMYLNDERFLYGNIAEQSFQTIWEGEQRKHSLAFVEQNLDVSGCRINCRMDNVNAYLWELRHPNDHVNFI